MNESSITNPRPPKKHKKTQRSKKIQNMLKKLSIFYVNIRDLKSKETSFKTRIEEVKPSIIAITETWMDEEDDISIEGYDTVYRNERKGKGGGILIAVHNNLMNIVCEIAQTKEMYESIWLVLNNGRINVKIGVVYFPQEKDVTILEAESIYSKISDEVREGRSAGQSIVILGDFNCKVGTKIKGNNKEQTAGGKMLLSLIREEKLALMNGSEICKGLWTRVEGNKKSVLDYVVVSKENRNAVGEMIIDEEKEFAPLRIKDSETKYSDHNVILVKLNVIEPEMQTAVGRNRTVVTSKGREKIRVELKEESVSKIWEEPGSVKEKYTKWSTKVKGIEEKHRTQVKKKKFTSKKVRIMKRMHKQLKEKRTAEEDSDKKREIIEEIKVLKTQVIEAEAEEKCRKIIKVVESISRNGKMNSGAFHEFRRKFKRKDEKPHAMINSEGKKVTEHGEIRKVYQDFYVELLNNKDQHENSMNNGNVSKTFQEIMDRAAEQPPLVVSKATVAATLKKMKRRKAMDDKGWNNELMKDGGDEMEKSIELMINAVLSEEVIPDEWNSMLIKSTHKKGEKSLMKNKRGLFLTNVVSKAFEKAVEIEMGPLRYDRFQSGGTKGLAPIDNWLIIIG